MKTVAVVISMIVLAPSILFAGNGDDKNKKENKLDSTEVKSTSKSSEEFSISIEEGEVNVSVNGDFGQYASVSLTTNRGSDIFFKFLENGNNTFTFDVSLLDEGSYFIVLNSNDEVRIKRFMLK